MISRFFKITLALMTLSSTAEAQVITRSEFAPYTQRKDADARTHNDYDTYIKFDPGVGLSDQGEIIIAQTVNMPQKWIDEVVHFHVEAMDSAYTLWINQVQVVTCEDTLTPTDYNISPYIKVGENTIFITYHPSKLDFLEQDVERPLRSQFVGSYFYIQNKVRILDYQLTMTEHTGGEHGRLFIDVIVENRFNTPGTISVGYDVYDPAGKLHDYSNAQITLEGNTTDTITFAPFFYGAKNYRWDPDSGMAMRRVGQTSARTTDQPLYSLMLFTRHNSVPNHFIPLKVGFTLPEYADGKLTAWDKELKLKAARYNATKSSREADTDLRKLKSQGYNTIQPDYPQPLWFYSLCDKIGLYVIEQAAINAPASAQDRTIGGTASNNPALTAEYLERVQKMYYRTRNFSCIVAYSLGGDSGNGYNMYKAYEWLKSVETRRPVIYEGAEGEWNSDILIIER